MKQNTDTGTKFWGVPVFKHLPYFPYFHDKVD